MSLPCCFTLLSQLLSFTTIKRSKARGPATLAGTVVCADGAEYAFLYGLQAVNDSSMVRKWQPSSLWPGRSRHEHASTDTARNASLGTSGLLALLANSASGKLPQRFFRLHCDEADSVLSVMDTRVIPGFLLRMGQRFEVDVCDAAGNRVAAVFSFDPKLSAGIDAHIDFSVFYRARFASHFFFSESLCTIADKMLISAIPAELVCFFCRRFVTVSFRPPMISHHERGSGLAWLSHAPAR